MTDPRLEACLVWAGRVRGAVRAVLAGDVSTPDLGGSARTGEVTEAVIDALRESEKSKHPNVL